MSNLLLQNPISITTAFSQGAGFHQGFKSQLGSSGVFNTLRVSKIYWENPLNVGDVVTIIDPVSGIVLMPLRCETAGQSQIIDWTADTKIWADFSVYEIDSGTLYIWFD